MNNLLTHERNLWQNGTLFVAGIDEVGRGCLAGPVVAAAVILPSDNNNLLSNLSMVNDSKSLSSKTRETLFPLIIENSVDYSIGIVSANVIDEINILQATFLAMRRAISGLEKTPEYILVDGNKKIPNTEIKQSAIVKGDSLSLSIASASIISKVIRDEIMEKISNNYPEYFFEKHKGYPTSVHIEAVKKFGLTDIHRVTFCKNFITPKENVKSLPFQLELFSFSK